MYLIPFSLRHCPRLNGENRKWKMENRKINRKSDSLQMTRAIWSRRSTEGRGRNTHASRAGNCGKDE